LKPEYDPARFRYAEALLRANRLNEAEEQFHKVQPATAHSLVGLALISLIRGDLDSARENLMEAIKINPKHAEAHGLLAQIYRRQNDLQRANEEQRLSNALPSKLPPDDPQLAEWMAEGISSYWYEWRGRAYLERGLYEPAIRQLESATKILPVSRIYTLLGIAYQNSKKFQKAVDQYRLALAKENSAATLNNLASALFELGKYQEATSTLEKAIALDPTFAYSYFQLSVFHLRSENSQEAIASLQRGHAAIPENRILALRLSWLLSTMKNSSGLNGTEAIRLAEAVCANQTPCDPESLDILAAAYAEAGDFDRSIQAAQEAYRMAIDQENLMFAEKVKLHLKNYEKKKPWRE
jgi:tetratricopeptide (TPR) repeat protein